MGGIDGDRNTEPMKFYEYPERNTAQLEIVRKFWAGELDGLTGKDVREMLEKAAEQISG